MTTAISPGDTSYHRGEPVGRNQPETVTAAEGRRVLRLGSATRAGSPAPRLGHASFAATTPSPGLIPGGPPAKTGAQDVPRSKKSAQARAADPTSQPSPGTGQAPQPAAGRVETPAGPRLLGAVSPRPTARVLTAAPADVPSTEVTARPPGNDQGPLPDDRPPDARKLGPIELAVATLDRVLELEAVAGDGTSLEFCQNMARGIRDDLVNGTHDADELAGFLDGTHPLASLVDLIDPREGLTDDDWARHLDAVSSAFGRPFALSVGRGHVRPKSERFVFIPKPSDDDACLVFDRTAF